MTNTMRSMLLASLSSAALAAPAAAQTAPQPQIDGEQIVVTGSRSANRTVANSPVPVDVISSEA